MVWKNSKIESLSLSLSIAKLMIMSDKTAAINGCMFHEWIMTWNWFVVGIAVCIFDSLIISFIMMMNFGIKLYFLEVIASFYNKKSLNERWKLKHTNNSKGWKIVALNFNIILSHFLLKDIVLASCLHQLFAERQPSSMCMYVVTKINDMKRGEWNGMYWSRIVTLYRQWYRIPFPYC